MKTLFKTITVVSIATLTALGTYQLNFTSLTTPKKSNAATPTVDIYAPSEINKLVSTAKTVATKEYKSVQQQETEMAYVAGLDNLVAFMPELDFTSIALPAVETSAVNAADIMISNAKQEQSETIDELIKYKPTVATIDSEELLMNQLTNFKPADVSVETIVEPVTMDELIKFVPAEVNKDAIVLPEQSIDELIKFEPSSFISTDIAEPQSIEELVKFKASIPDCAIIEEPVIATPCNYITQYPTGL